MSEKIITFILSIIVIFVVYILIRLLHNRRTDDGTGESIDRARTENTDATKSVEDAQRTTDEITDTVDELSKLSGRSKELIEQIKKQRVEK